MKLSDGTLGWRVQAPFDRIIVTAGGPNLPLPLLERWPIPGSWLPGGAGAQEQKLLRVSKREGRVTARAFGNVAFVILLGIMAGKVSFPCLLWQTGKVLLGD